MLLRSRFEDQTSCFVNRNLGILRSKTGVLSTVRTGGGEPV
jgi:hypothetical protein